MTNEFEVSIARGTEAMRQAFVNAGIDPEAAAVIAAETERAALRSGLIRTLEAQVLSFCVYEYLERHYAINSDIPDFLTDLFGEDLDASRITVGELIERGFEWWGQLRSLAKMHALARSQREARADE